MTLKKLYSVFLRLFESETRKISNRECVLLIVTETFIKEIPQCRWLRLDQFR